MTLTSVNIFDTFVKSFDGHLKQYVLFQYILRDSVLQTF